MSGKGFLISTSKVDGNNQRHLRYEPTAVDPELAGQDVIQERMEDELSKLKTFKQDALESSLLETQEEISRKMAEDFRVRKLDAALHEMHRNKESTTV